MKRILKNIVLFTFLLINFVIVFHSENIQAKSFKIINENPTKFGGYYYMCLQSTQYPTVLKISRSSSKNGIYDNVTDLELANSPYINNNKIYYVNKKEGTFVTDQYGIMRCTLVLKEYDIKNRKSKTIGKIASDKVDGQIVYFYKNNLYIQLNEDVDGTVKSLYSINIKNGKCKKINKNFHIYSNAPNSNYSYKNFLVGKNYTTGTGGYQLKVVNLKTGKVRNVCKSCGATYVKGKYIYFVNRKGIYSEDATYALGYKTAKVNKIKFGKSKAKTLKKIKVNTCTWFNKLTNKKLVYTSVVSKSGSTKTKTIKFK